MAIKCLCIGDQHIKTDNLRTIEILYEKLDCHLKNNKYDVIISMGDLLHTHERLNSLALNVAVKYLELLSSHAKTYVLVGNHDYINCSQFLTTNHWLNCVKHINNITVVDKVYSFEKDKIKIIMCPFVPDGRFVEALNTYGDWKNANCIFGHQLLDGCKMGCMIVKDIEEWKKEYPMCICGHIHEKQIISSNLRYIGSVLQDAFGERDKTITEVIIDTNNITFKEYSLDLPCKKTITIDSSELFKFKFPINTDFVKYKVIINGNENDFKTFKLSDIYKNVPRDIKIEFKNTKKSIEEKKEKILSIKNYNINFYDVLKETIYNEKDNDMLKEILKEFIQ